MAQLDLIIRGGTVATAGGAVDCDVGIRDGRIAALADEIAGNGAEVIDARGRLVLPGGIDSHCHIAQVSSAGIETTDDFLSGTRSAAAGGTTCIIPFAAQRRGDSLRHTVEAYHARAEGNAIIDYAFHLIISDPTEHVLGQELPALIEDGYTSFKIYMTYDILRLDDRHILEVLSTARRHGAMVMVHAENHDVIGWLTDQLLEASKRAPKYHGVAHAAIAESEATHRAIALSETVGLPILIVHVSGRDAIDEIARARAAACPSTARLARSTCSSPPTTWTGRVSRAPSSCAARRPATPPTKSTYGAVSKPVSSRCSRRTTHPIDTLDPTERRRGGSIRRSTRSPMGCRAWRRGSRSCSQRACGRDG